VTNPVSNPILILPGVGLWSGLFEGMRQTLQTSLATEKIFVVDVSLLDWIGFPPSPSRSTNRVMACLDKSVKFIEARFPNEPITLIAHSGGGTVAMIYLLGKNFQGDAYSNTSVTKLITLGTPFRSEETYAKLKSDFLNENLDDTFFNHVKVVSVISRAVNGNPNGSAFEIAAYKFYENNLGAQVTESCEGDGVVPVASCKLNGATLAVIERVVHLPSPFDAWYGSPEGVEQWQSWL
jgi:pimeloyl-ACP methyl ester carboxylesterase